MDLQIFANNLDLTPDIHETINKKLVGKLEKYFKKTNGENHSRLTISRGERFGFTAKLELVLHTGEKLFAENSGKELVSALTGLSQEITRIINKTKEKNSF